ncbi:transposase [Streptomyces sp. NBC_01717]|uniref:transposase n=1 Tax=Streptomyces sp. NBC_01717 TaxID=2975918 RepID=UPI002E379707|nr:transposase [Streptomyces sp. NBC_01717]
MDPWPLPRRAGTSPGRRKYKLRAGVEETINQAITVTGIRHARYRGQAGKPKVRPQHAFSALAINLIKLDA